MDDWKVHTEYHDYSESDNTISWFWQVVEGMTMEQRRKRLLPTCLRRDFLGFLLSFTYTEPIQT